MNAKTNYKTCYIKTFGCSANEADSERIASYYMLRGYKQTSHIQDADCIVINTCMIRESAENRVYGLAYNVWKQKQQGRDVKIIVTGCMVGMAARDTSGKLLRKLQKNMPYVDEFLPIEEVGFDYEPIRTLPHQAIVPISNGCNNFCTYCVVPFARGKEISRPIDTIITECRHAVANGQTDILLVGQNVNSYGADIVKNDSPEDSTVQITYVKHLGRMRIPTLFPQLLQSVATTPGVTVVRFLSSNPWDFSDALIDVIAAYQNISREIHLPVQSGDNTILQKMNRWYTREEYIALVKKIKQKIKGATITTDIIVGFCGETDEQFAQTVSLCKQVGFSKAYISKYSDRPMTAAHKLFTDDVPYTVKKQRWHILEHLINQSD